MEDKGIFASALNASNVLLDDDQLEGGGNSVTLSIVENRAREVCLCKIDSITVRQYL